MRRLPGVVTAAVLAGSLWTAAAAQRMDAFVESRHHPAIGYGRGAIHTPVAELNERLADGRATLSFEPRTGYLRATLEALDISPDSQVLVFSQTSFQASHIRYDNPRAIYFNDTVSVGWIPGAPLLELTAQDPRHGTLFYSLGQTPTERPQFGRQEQCVSCHLTWDTLGVPGLTVRTTLPPATGHQEPVNGGPVDHRRPFAERWSGWFVTGRDVPAGHLGNRPLTAEGEGSAPDRMETVAGPVDVAKYLRPTSDVVALMLLEHQTQASNLITRLGWEARLGDATRTRVAAGMLADYLLFVDEAPLPGRISGGSAFAEAFIARGPRDSRGRSLRDLQLEGRLMRYPLSYMVETAMFEQLPDEARALVVARLAEVLGGREKSPKYAHLTPDVREAILEILRETKPELASALH